MSADRYWLASCDIALAYFEFGAPQSYPSEACKFVQFGQTEQGTGTDLLAVTTLSGLLHLYFLVE